MPLALYFMQDDFLDFRESAQHYHLFEAYAGVQLPLFEVESAECLSERVAELSPRLQCRLAQG